MKKIVFVFGLLLFSMSVFAQKTYLVLSKQSAQYSDYYILSGDIPSGMKYHMEAEDVAPNSISTKRYEGWVGYLLNKLVEYGFVVEQTTGSNYLLSRTNGGAPNRVAKVVSDDEDVYEVARYNLQGMPIPKTEKGIQIIVYSNYTTKTVIVE